MATRKTTLFYALLIAVASLAVGMVIASRLDLSPPSSAQTMAVPAMNSAPLTGALTAQTFRDVADSAMPAVVNIRTESRQRAQELTEFFGGDDFLRRFFPNEIPPRRQQRDRVVQAAGSGFIISRDGLILTNNHVVEGASRVVVSLYGENSDQEYVARVVGRDPLTDSALIELTEKPDHTLPVSKFGDSGQIAPGDWVMAIGNPFGLAHTVSVGVVSSVTRSLPVATQRYQEMIQTDAAINPGNSGGPLLNVRGEVVGVNTMIYANMQSGNIGIGFAVPINAVSRLLPQLRTGKVTRGMIGVEVAPVPRNAVEDFGLKERRGAVVSAVTAGGPADKGGLKPGDVIVEVNGVAIKDRDQLVSEVVALKPGTTVPIQVVRDRKETSLNVTIGELNLDEEGSREARGDSGEESTGFGLTLGSLTAEAARSLGVPAGTSGALVTDVDPSGTAGRAGIRPGNVILEVNRRAVSSPAEARRMLQEVPSGGTAFLLVWQAGGAGRAGTERFLTVPKE